MRSVITQSIVLPAAAEELFRTYLDPDRHAALTGAPVIISAVAGSPFSAFGGSLSGTTLAVVAPVLIVQSWRSENFHDDDPHSTLILSFTPQGARGRIDLVHLDVPAQDFDGVDQGWEQYYWRPWRERLAAAGAAH